MVWHAFVEWYDSRLLLLLQVEFYFSDSNVPRDVFLIGKIKDDPQVRSWVPACA